MGYLHGQDRLWQMEFDRLAGQGRLAEVLGEAALPIDRYLRTLGLAQRAEADLAAQSPADLTLLEAYTKGVNAAIADYGVALPPEFLLLRYRPEPWRPVDCLRLQKLLALTLSRNWRQEGVAKAASSSRTAARIAARSSAGAALFAQHPRQGADVADQLHHGVEAARVGKAEVERLGAGIARGRRHRAGGGRGPRRGRPSGRGASGGVGATGPRRATPGALRGW